MERETFDTAVIGGGPAGLAAALAAQKAGANAVVIERESRTGGILKQCIHDGFGLVRYGEKLTGPEYACRFVREIKSSGIRTLTETYVSLAEKKESGTVLTCVNKERGIVEIASGSLVLATGCRERTDRQVFIHGERPSGVFTAGLAQYFVNIQGFLPGHKCVILGSGDIGLIMARRLTLEGMEVEGVYEIKSEPSGLSRNVRQCLGDFGIPLHLSMTVTEISGTKRVEGVWVAPVDGALVPVLSERRFIPCDTLILSVGLIPENEIAKSLGVGIDPKTKGPIVDQRMETLVSGVFSCGNALHVNDLVDYVSDSGETAGNAAAKYSLGRGKANSLSKPVAVQEGAEFLSVIPQLVRPDETETAMYFRVSKTFSRGGTVRLRYGAKTLFKRNYKVLRPPEMERFNFTPFESAIPGAELILEFETGAGAT